MNSVSVLVFVCISLVAAKGDDSNPAIEYTCKGTGEIEFDLSNIHATYHTYAVAPSAKLGSGNSNQKTQPCEIPLSSITNVTQPTALYNCTFPVYLYLMREHISKDIVGGKNVHEYILSCELPHDGLDFTAMADIKPVTYPTLETKLAHFNIALSMAIQPTKVAIGDKLTITITETGSAMGTGHFLLPKFCQATDGTAQTKNLTLLENGKLRDSDLLERFDVRTKGKATTSLYAFKFLNTDNVHISCTVTVCNDDTCVDKMYTTTSPITPNPPNTGGNVIRRRRSAKDPETYKVSAAFKIIDKETINQVSGQSIVRVDPMVLLSLVLFTIATTLRKI